MKINVPEMIDIVFDISGETPPSSYPFDLWAEMVRLSPQLAEQKHAGVLPIRLTEKNDQMPLPKRTKLALRLPAALADQVMTSMSEQKIEVDGCVLQIGKGKKRLIQPYSTIHAQIVAGEPEETRFMDDINIQLTELGLSGNLICGKQHSINGGTQSIHGFSLVIHDLKPDASLRLQYAGLGGLRQFGCGIFIPYKVISGLSDD